MLSQEALTPTKLGRIDRSSWTLTINFAASLEPTTSTP
jgi:hypothetical protein